MVSPGFWIFLSLPLILTGQMYRWRRQARKEYGVQPVTHALLRPAGESLRIRIDELNEKFSEDLFFALAFPIVTAAILFFSKAAGNILAQVLVLVAVLPIMAFYSRRLMKDLAELRSYRIGFHGERAAAEELNELMLRRCRVFHDVPVPGYKGNIDHVVISRTGVYAIETKTRGKRETDGKDRHILRYNGREIIYPSGYRDTEALSQAQVQAKKLSQYLSEATGDTIKVTPIVVLPGWYVEDSSKWTDIPVRNPKGVRHVVLDPKKARVDQQILRRAVYQLKRQCRDVTL
jgi:hypothetical protein